MREVVAVMEVPVVSVVARSGNTCRFLRSVPVGSTGTHCGDEPDPDNRRACDRDDSQGCDSSTESAAE